MKPGTLVKVHRKLGGALYARRVPEALPMPPVHNAADVDKYQDARARVFIEELQPLSYARLALYVTWSKDANAKTYNCYDEIFYMVLLDGKHVWLSARECTLEEVCKPTPTEIK